MEKKKWMVVFILVLTCFVNLSNEKLWFGTVDVKNTTDNGFIFYIFAYSRQSRLVIPLLTRWSDSISSLVRFGWRVYTKNPSASNV